MRAVVMPERALAIQQLAASFKLGVPCPLKVFQRMLGLMASESSVLQLGLLHMRPLQYWLKPRVPPHAWRNGRLRVKVNQACVAALAPWKNHQWMEQGMPLGKLNLGADMLSRSNVPLDEWMLHQQTVQEIWGIFGRPQVHLSASEDNTHCQT